MSYVDPDHHGTYGAIAPSVYPNLRNVGPLTMAHPAPDNNPSLVHDVGPNLVHHLSRHLDVFLYYAFCY